MNNTTGTMNDYLYPYDTTRPLSPVKKGTGGKKGRYQDKSCSRVQRNYGVLKCTDCPLPECTKRESEK